MFNLIIAAVFAVLGVLFLTGALDVILMLNNSITLDGTPKYDIKAVGNFVGKAMFFVAAFFVVVHFGVTMENTIIKYLGYGACMVTIITTITHLNTSPEFLAKPKKKKRK